VTPEVASIGFQELVEHATSALGTAGVRSQ
jgi:hypothetical protein